MLVDSHCHLDFDAFDEDRIQALDRAAAAGVGRMVTICTRLSRFEEVRALARDHGSVDCSVGIHPHNVEDEGIAETARLVALAAEPEVVGIGETGLDYYYDHSPRDDQRASFRNHIAAARETGLPLIVHTRDADDDTAAILGEEMEEGGFAGVIHCFSAGAALARGRDRPRALYFLLRDRDIQEIGRAARNRGRGSAGPHTRRDRRPLSGAGAEPGEAQRARLRRPHRRRDRRRQGHRS